MHCSGVYLEYVMVHAAVQTVRGWQELHLHQVHFMMMIRVAHLCVLVKHIWALLN